MAEAALAALIDRGFPYRSATEYEFNEDETDAIVRTVSYHRKDFDHAVIWFSPREHHDIRPSIATPFPRSSDVGSGFFDRLPLELFRDILFRLDIRSLFQLRQTNLRAREAVDSLKEYQIIVSHGLNLLCALLRTDLARDISLLDFYDVLCTKTCSICGEFGGFVSLLSWARCCFRCISRSAPRARVRTLAGVQRQYRMTQAGREQLRSIKTLPGVYKMSRSVHEGGITIVSHQQAVLISQHPLKALKRAGPPNRRLQNPKYNYMGSCALPYYDKLTGDVEHGMSCAGCKLDKVYSREGLLEHFKWCKQAQLLWKSTHGGK